MSKIKVSLIEDTSGSDVEENHESDKPMEPVLSDEPPPPPPHIEKPKRIRKKPEPKPIPSPEAPPPPPAPEPEQQQAKGKMINCINWDKKVQEDIQILPSVKMQTKRKRRTSQKYRSKTRKFYCGFWLSMKNPTTCEIHSFNFKAVKSN